MKKILIYVLGTLGIIIAIPLCLFGYWRLTYYTEMHSIEKSLNLLPGVSVKNIWGHDDITLEEVTARLKIKDQGEIVLYGLSKDVYDYPDTVWISEIDGMSFKVFHKDSVGSSINIGRKGSFSKFFPFTFRSEADVVQRYDEITKIINSWPSWPDLLHFYSSDGEEIFLAILPQRKEDTDPIYDLVGIESLFQFKDTLPWGTKE